METTETATPRAISLPTVLVGLRGASRASLPREILAGVTLAALMIPLNIGYAQVAGLSPVTGLYAAILPMVLWALFSSSRNLVASPDAPISALVASILVAFAIPGDPYYEQLAFALALLSAVFFFLFWFFKLGYLANFLSRAVLIGFITGLGIEVLTSQIEKIMGISVEAEGYFQEVFEMVRSIPEANIYSVLIGVGAILIIWLLRRYAPKLPGALIALIIATAVVAIFGLVDKGVSVLGPVPAGLPSIAFPRVSLWDWARLVPGAVAVTAITVAEGLLIDRQYGQKYKDPLDADQELFAFGAANTAAGLTGALVVGSSASRTAAMDDAGMRSQVPSLVAAGVVAVILLFFTDALALLPNAALGGIVAYSVLKLIEVGELRELFHLRRSEFWIAIACTLSVLVLGPLSGVVIAFLLSTIDVVRLAARPRTAVLTELPGEGIYASAGAHQAAITPGLILYRFGAPLYFANANLFRDQAQRLLQEADPPAEWFVLDAESITDIDTTGEEALAQVIEMCRERQVIFALARAHQPVPDLLEHYGLMAEIGQERVYRTNRDAVRAFYQETGRPIPERIEATDHD
jgi:high affinity sulfate transporter 1